MKEIMEYVYPSNLYYRKNLGKIFNKIGEYVSLRLDSININYSI